MPTRYGDWDAEYDDQDDDQDGMGYIGNYTYDNPTRQDSIPKEGLVNIDFGDVEVKVASMIADTKDPVYKRGFSDGKNEGLKQGTAVGGKAVDTRLRKQFDQRVKKLVSKMKAEFKIEITKLIGEIDFYKNAAKENSGSNRRKRLIRKRTDKP